MFLKYYFILYIYILCCHKYSVSSRKDEVFISSIVTNLFIRMLNLKKEKKIRSKIKDIFSTYFKLPIIFRPLLLQIKWINKGLFESSLKCNFILFSFYNRNLVNLCLHKCLFSVFLLFLWIDCLME